MSRNFLDPNDNRNFSSLLKEARKYSKNDANALRNHYKVLGALTALAPIAVGCLLGELDIRIGRRQPAYTRIIKEKQINAR